MPLRENFTYQLSNTYVTSAGENRLIVDLYCTVSEEVEGNFVNTSAQIASFNFGIGIDNPSTTNVESLLKTAVPQYFTE